MQSTHSCQSKIYEPVVRQQKPIQSLHLVFAFRAEVNCKSEDFFQTKVTHIPRKVLACQESAIHRQDPNKKRHWVHMQFFYPPDDDEEEGVDYSTNQDYNAPQVVVI